MAWYSDFFDRISGRSFARAEAQRIAKEMDRERRRNWTFDAPMGNAGFNWRTMGGLDAGAKWAGGLSRSGRIHYVNPFTSRMNARAAYHDSVLMHGTANTLADSIAHTGLQLEPTPKFEMLGLTMEEAERWSSDIGDRFHLWATSKKQHRAGQMTFYQAQRFYALRQQVDNDLFVRLYYSDKKDLLNTLQFSFLDPNQIRGNAMISTYMQNNLNDGIERDADGAEVAFKVWVLKGGNEDGGTTYEEVRIPVYGPKSKKRFMIHGFFPEYAGQGRGYSLFTHVLQEFENVTDFTVAQVKKAIAQSQLTLYTKPSKDAPASDPFAGITGRGAGPAASQFGTVPVPSDDALNVTPEAVRPIVDFQNIPEAQFRAAGSTGVFNLNEGEDLAAFPNTAPAQNFDTFVDTLASHLSASNGAPLEIVLRKFNANYSASRAALIMFWLTVEMWRQEMSADFLNPIYEYWLTEEVAAGRVKAYGWSDPFLRAAWLSCNWMGVSMPNIDPEKTAKAGMLNAELGATTLDRLARDLNGSTGKANRAQLNREYKELGVPPFAQSSGRAPAVPTEKD